jgi:hypothetical protein
VQRRVRFRECSLTRRTGGCCWPRPPPAPECPHCGVGDRSVPAHRFRVWAQPGSSSPKSHPCSCSPSVPGELSRPIAATRGNSGRRRAARRPHGAAAAGRLNRDRSSFGGVRLSSAGLLQPRRRFPIPAVVCERALVAANSGISTHARVRSKRRLLRSSALVLLGLRVPAPPTSTNTAASWTERCATDCPCWSPTQLLGALAAGQLLAAFVRRRHPARCSCWSPNDTSGSAPMASVCLSVQSESGAGERPTVVQYLGLLLLAGVLGLAGLSRCHL